jgi:hypothetical protein
MTIINEDEIKIHIVPPKVFHITDAEIQEIYRHVKMAGGSEVVRNKVLKILSDVVERTG